VLCLRKQRQDRGELLPGEQRERDPEALGQPDAKGFLKEGQQHSVQLQQDTQVHAQPCGNTPLIAQLSLHAMHPRAQTSDRGELGPRETRDRDADAAPERVR